jgi:hypothetical protein
MKDEFSKMLKASEAKKGAMSAVAKAREASIKAGQETARSMIGDALRGKTLWFKDANHNPKEGKFCLGHEICLETYWFSLSLWGTAIEDHPSLNTDCEFKVWMRYPGGRASAGPVTFARAEDAAREFLRLVAENVVKWEEEED